MQTRWTPLVWCVGLSCLIAASALLASVLLEARTRQRQDEYAARWSAQVEDLLRRWRILTPVPQPVDLPAPPLDPVPTVPPPVLPDSVTGLLSAAHRYPGARVQESALHPDLVAAATAHAQYQAQQCTQGHQHWETRAERLRQTLGGYQFAEICAESWPWQKDDPPPALGWEMFRCWELSPGHWSVARRPHRFWGADMAQGRNGVWYACVIVAD